MGIKAQAAVVWEAGAPLSLEEIELDDPREDEIVVRVVACGVCHTDEAARLGQPPVSFPLVLGHEGAGIVERTGSEIHAVKPGDRVLFTPDYCGRCEQCRLGYTPYCDDAGPLSFAGAERASCGGRRVRTSFFGQSSFATRAVVSERNIVPVPADAPLHLLAGLTCGIQTGAGAILNAMPVGSSDAVAVFGSGAVGLSAVMAAVASGARSVVAVDRVPSRLSAALELGATYVIDTSGRTLDSVASEVVEATGGGADSVLDTTSDPGVILAGVQSLATHGTCSVITGSGAPVAVPPGALLMKGRKLRGTVGGHINPTVFIPRLIEMHRRGRFPFDRLVKNYPFTEVATAMADSLAGGTIKPVLTF
ncbi:MAG: NAD(P)-dependent alcohol dehydrogenase [Streptosporangiales bacterium]|nr:NAD(P)-dependent alcohol dehydrogenase [Streptosporangiales bacterium]